MSVFRVVKRKSEILQMAVLELKLAILDETDSGFDIDTKIVFEGVSIIRKERPGYEYHDIYHHNKVFGLYQTRLCAC